MSNPANEAVTLTAAVATAVTTAQTITGASAFTINGTLASNGVAVLTSTGLKQRRVVFLDSGTSDTAVIFTIKGTNSSGAPIGETVTGVTTSAVSTVFDYATVTSVTTSGSTVGTVSVGTSATASSPWISVSPFFCFWALSVAVWLTGTATYTVEHTYDDPNGGRSGPNADLIQYQWSNEATGINPPRVSSLTALTSKSANAEAQYVDQPIMAIRITVTSGTGTAALQVLQAGMGEGA